MFTLFKLVCLLAFTINHVCCIQNILVEGGQTVNEGELPYQLSLGIKESTGLYCGASLVEVEGYQVALTAANCTRAANLTLSGGMVNWFFGANNKQTREVLKFVAHPDYSRASLSNNIALLFFEPFELNDYVKPIQLPSAGQQTLTGNLSVSGWGNDGDNIGLPTMQLRVGELSVVDDASCQEFYTILDTQIIDSMLCGISNDQRVAPTNFDNGGPAVSTDGYLAGVYTFNDTGFDIPAVFTEVSYFVDWIKETVDEYQSGISTGTTMEPPESTSLSTEKVTERSSTLSATPSTDQTQTISTSLTSDTTSLSYSTTSDETITDTTQGITSPTKNPCKNENCSNASPSKTCFNIIVMFISGFLMYCFSNYTQQINC